MALRIEIHNELNRRLLACGLIDVLPKARSVVNVEKTSRRRIEAREKRTKRQQESENRMRLAEQRRAIREERKRLKQQDKQARAEDRERRSQQLQLLRQMRNSSKAESKGRGRKRKRVESSEEEDSFSSNMSDEDDEDDYDSLAPAELNDEAVLRLPEIPNISEMFRVLQQSPRQ